MRSRELAQGGMWRAALVVLLTAGCAVSPKPLAPAPAALVPTPPPSPDDLRFDGFVKSFRQTALGAGIAPELYDAAMAGVRRQPRIVGHNAVQPEFVKPVWTYLDDAVLPRIAPGKARLAENAALLDVIEVRYGVPKEIAVSIWGNETDFGKVLGRYNLFSALANLAFEGPRVSYARPQLLAALTIAQEQKIAPGEMVSSWAGAFGQTQFVPTSFLGEAVDGDGDGRIDLWHSSADALASTSHLLADAGWARGQPWGFEVLLPAGFAFEQADLSAPKPVSFWSDQGVRRPDGASLTAAAAGAPAGALLLPAGAKGPAFLVFPNFRVLLKYNAATSYALAVCLLADRLKGLPELTTPWPRAEPPMGLAERVGLQDGLKRLGFDPGATDGVIGSKTRQALRAYQLARGLPADGFATHALAERVTAEAATAPAGNAGSR